MNTALHVARREWTQMLRDGRFRLAAAGLLLLLLAALGAGIKQHRDRQADAEAAHRIGREQWVGQADKNPHNAAHFGVYVVKPAGPLAAVEPGVDSYLGTALLLEAHKRHEASFRPARDAAPALRFGELTAGVVLQYLIPLLILAFTAPAFAEEREQGTLRQTLSLGITPRSLAVGKAAGVGAVFAVVLVPAALLGSAALFIAIPSGSGDTALRIALLAAVYLFYFTIFLGLGLAASAMARTTQTALVLVLGFWLLAFLVIPRAAATWARSQHPLPTAREFEEQILRSKAAHAQQGEGTGRAKMIALQKRLMRQYNVSRLEDLPVNPMGVGLQEGEEETAVLLAQNYARLWGTMERQNRDYQYASVLAPVLAMRAVSMGIAGSDWQAYRAFADAAEQYRRRFVKSLNNNLASGSRASDHDYRVGRKVWAALPEFGYAPPTVAGIFARQSVSLVVLALWGGVALLLGSFCAMRVRPL